MTTILIISDLHIGSTVSICRPVVNLDDGGTYHISDEQSWLWRKWNAMIDQVIDRKDEEHYTIINGDAVEGDTKKRSFQVISHNPATILREAAEILDPIARFSTGLFFVRGTDAHTGKSAHLEEQLAADLGGVKCPKTDTYSWFHLPLVFEDVLIDIAHHPGIGVGKNPWTAHNSIHTLAGRVLFEYANARRPIPHLVIRSHNHTLRDSRDDYRVRAITTPAWTLPTEYIHRIAPGALSDIGALLIHCSAGYYEVDVMHYPKPPDPVVDVRSLINAN